MKIPFAMALLIGGLCSPLAFAGVRASSEGQTSEGERLPASYAVDGLLTTAWAEGVDGDGAGSTLELQLDRSTEVRMVSIWPGRIDRGNRGLREYGRPHTVTITLDGGVSTTVRVLDIAETGPARVDIPIEGTTKSVKVSIDEAYAGGIRNDTYLTEVAINFSAGEAHPSVKAFEDWRASEAGQKELTAFATILEEGKAAVASSDFGERDTFALIKAAAIDGSPAEQKRVKAVADGYRVQALPPNRTALNALLALEDPNAIVPIELAATRTTGDLQAALQDRASRFQALSELKGGDKRNVKAFGETGWCTGCLRSFGEPLPIVVDGYGTAWIADMANNRVQTFSFDGISRGRYGKGEPTLTDNWLSRKRDWYAAAMAPSSGQGGFTLPLALALLPGKGGDDVFVLDAAGQVSRLDPDGKVKSSFNIGVSEPLSPRVGGQAHLAIVKGKLAVAWSDTGLLFDLEGKELARYTFADGAPSALIGLKNGTIAGMFGDELVSVNPTDGYRYQSLLGDTLPDGFENVALTLDERGKLWVVTDNGIAIKYKKPGRVDFQVKLRDQSYAVPRIAVYQDLVFITDRDAFTKVDALSLSEAAP